MRRTLIAAALLACAPLALAGDGTHCKKHATEAASATSERPYAGEETRAVKSLSDDDVNALRSGAGMGLAKPAELNHYPGPKHVIDLAAELKLSDAQLDATRGAFDAMKTEAVRLGNAIVEKEAALDRLFASGTASAASVANATAEIASLQGRLRAVHLGAHLRMREIMTPEQIAAYDALRGYAGGHHASQ